MEQYKFNDNDYVLIQDDKCFDFLDIKDYITDYFEKFDYIFGDFSADKVRLKGFYNSDCKNVKKYNDIQYLEFYKREYCNYGARTFLLEKVCKK